MKGRMTGAAAAGMALAMALATALAGCGGGGDAKADDIITYATVEPQKPLVPTDTYVAGAATMIGTMFSGLVGYRADGTAVNEVAKSITPKNGNTEYDITLKPGWKFTDGTPVTSKSFTRAWSYGANAKNAQLCASYFESIKGYDELQDASSLKGDEQLSGLKVTDDTHFTVQLNAPNSIFPITLGYNAFMPLPDSFFKDPKGFGQHPVGNGPYKFKSWTHNQIVQVRRNPDYHGRFPAHNGGIDFRIYSAFDAAYADVQGGNLDLLDQIPSTALSTFQKDTSMGHYNTPSSSTGAFAIPYRLAHFSGEEGVLRRRAISMAIDRKQICSKIFHGTATPAKDFSAPVVSGYAEGLKGSENIVYNPDKAKQLWAQADAISPWSGDFTITGPAGGNFNAVYTAVANEIKNVLGIKTGVALLPTSGEFLDAVSERKVTTAYRGGWTADYPALEDYLTPLFRSTTESGKANDYDSPEFDGLLDRAAATSGGIAAANKVYQQAEEVLLSDLPTIPLYNENARAVYSTKLKNVKPGWNSVPVLNLIEKG